MLASLLGEPLEEARHVLLVDDDPVLRELVADALRDAGLVVAVAASADEAQRYLLAGNRVELVFSDVEMPGSVDGVGLRHWIRQNFPEVEILLASGKGAPAGAGPFLQKPYGLQAATKLARTLIDAKRR